MKLARVIHKLSLIIRLSFSKNDVLDDSFYHQWEQLSNNKNLNSF